MATQTENVPKTAVVPATAAACSKDGVAAAVKHSFSASPGVTF